ncbi:MAG: hypothetical protein QXO51_07345 [Halobacteria archaeon]
MTWLEWAVYATGALSMVSAIPLIRALRSNMELARARVFLRWKTYVRGLRVVAFVGAVFILVLLADNLLSPDEYVAASFFPVRTFQLILQVGAAYYGWTILSIARGPRQPATLAAGALVLISPGVALKGVLIATGIPAFALLLTLGLITPHENEAVKARYYLQFKRTNRVTEGFIAAAIAGFGLNLAYFAFHPETLWQTGFLAPTGIGILAVQVSFIAVAWFVTFTMRGLLLRPSRS